MSLWSAVERRVVVLGDEESGLAKLSANWGAGGEIGCASWEVW